MNTALTVLAAIWLAGGLAGAAYALYRIWKDGRR